MSPAVPQIGVSTGGLICHSPARGGWQEGRWVLVVVAAAGGGGDSPLCWAPQHCHSNAARSTSRPGGRSIPFISPPPSFQTFRSSAVSRQRRPPSRAPLVSEGGKERVRGKSGRKARGRRSASLPPPPPPPFSY